MHIFITGGSGFLGKALIRELLADDCLPQVNEIKNYDINDLETIQSEKIKTVQGDIRDYEHLKKACKGADLVIHTAAIVDWGTRSEEEILSVNTTGTENVIRACMENNIKYLVHTSTLDVVLTGKPLVNIDESIDYPEKHLTSYCESKTLAEKAVLAVNNERLKTVALRPSDIYGEADPYHMDSLINMAKGGFYVRLGNGRSKSQHVYAGNMAHALVKAAHELMNGNDKIAGKAAGDFGFQPRYTEQEAFRRTIEH